MMTEAPVKLFNSSARSKWLRLRTLILLRWLAIVGQLAAIIIANRVLEVSLRLDLCAAALGVSASFNIVTTVIFPANNRLSERGAMLTLMFDLFQLAFLVSLTGGLSNPFVILMLSPVIISATALTIRATVVVGMVFLSLISLLVRFYIPLTTFSGELIKLPDLLIYGTWAALVTSGVFLASYAHRVTEETFSMSEALTATQLALGREQRLTALGGVIAAAAHELGTPLATIKLVAAELADELGDSPHLYNDAKLIGTQADRCRDILRDMGRSGKDDTHLHHTPVSAAVEEAAAPHMDRGKMIIIRVAGTVQPNIIPDQPEILRRAEIIHGLRNLVQNAVDFAAARVWIDIDWDDKELRIHIGDDGMGYPSDLIGKIGDPFVRKRKEKQRSQSTRPEYEGMGLGLFIAKTLLERSGARLTFANGSEVPRKRSRPPSGPPELARATGAIVEVVWRRSDIEAMQSIVRGPLGENIKHKH
ncbi:MAG: ActS/PrrB/RegB family redox-sensitive histidine kinase [Paracoccaceae bacterium]